MIGNISMAQSALTQLLSGSSGAGQAAGSQALSPTAATLGGSSAAAQDLQSFMSSLIQELRQSGEAAISAGTGAPSLAAAGAKPGAGSTGSSASAHHHGGGHHVSTQLESLLQQLQGSSISTDGASAAAALANSGTQNGAGNSLQASFQRLLQDLKTSGAGQIVRTSA